MVEKIQTEKSIQKWLDFRFSGNSIKYTVPNIYLFKHDWETDYLVVQKSSKYCYEIEIKTTRSDFFNDFNKKDKHRILSEGVYSKKKYRRIWNETKTQKISENYYTDVPWNFRPNKFYYCVPEGMITEEEVPPYAGLMYVRGNQQYASVFTIKEPPFIHKEKLSLEEKLCQKFYYYWKDEEKHNMILEQKKILYENQILNLKKSLKS
jgi:hypothetical protein